MGRVTLDVVIEQKHPEMAPYVVVPAAKVARWRLDGTTTIEGLLDGVSLGRRSLKRWDESRWFLELPRGTLSALGKGPGARTRLSMTVASAELPTELTLLIEADATARAHWEAHSEAQQRMLREHIFAAKSSDARGRRARKALLPAAKPPSPRVVGLGTAPREIDVRILAKRLPGRTCGPYTEVAVGMVEKVGCHPEKMIAADAREARWQTRIEVREERGEPRYRGRSVNGPPHERFIYLTWIGRKGGEAPARFRRAKLRLDAVPAEVLAGALRSGVLIGRLALTAADGMPVAASVLPPAITWSAG